ncbi:MAG: HAMP domain-containing protein [Candidatus Eisenbacteria bacterium]|nr:HAMP domain-containing protein [Candidatus Eisenbacteria bacterium]
MLKNDVAGLYAMIRTIGSEPGLTKIRIFNSDGQISYSTDSLEVGRVVDRAAEACIGCHEDNGIRSVLPESARSRYLRAGDGTRILALIQPIHNEPACSNAACHAHPPEQQVLGVLDTQMSLAELDAQAAAMTRSLLIWLLISLSVVLLLSIGLLEIFVLRPIGKLREMTRRITHGDLDHEIPVTTTDELGEFATSFNVMTRELREARGELTAWGRTLEQRVHDKTAELERAHEHVIRVERMASIGKLAAIVAHEINNPLAGIKTYAVLLQRRLARAREASAPPTGALDDTPEILGTIANEAGRLGDIVRNLLQFSRSSPLRVSAQSIDDIIRRSIRLVQHQIDLQSVELNLEIAPEVASLECDGAQIQQAMVAILINALEATREGGALEITARPCDDRVEIRIRDNGVGMDAETLAHAFDPFFTTKESSSSNGLGLAVVYGIVTRHGGSITLESTPMQGTTVRLLLPRVIAAKDAKEETWSPAMTS